jgi:hypothetical protein
MGVSEGGSRLAPAWHAGWVGAGRGCWLVQPPCVQWLLARHAAVSPCPLPLHLISTLQCSYTTFLLRGFTHTRSSTHASPSFLPHTEARCRIHSASRCRHSRQAAAPFALRRPVARHGGGLRGRGGAGRDPLPLWPRGAPHRGGRNKVQVGGRTLPRLLCLLFCGSIAAWGSAGRGSSTGCSAS